MVIKMAKWSTVIFGFILTLIVYLIFGRYEFYGLLIVGFIVGYMAHQGVFGGMWNAALAGAFGTIISAILFYCCINPMPSEIIYDKINFLNGGL